MNIPAMSMAISRANTANAVSTSVMKMALDSVSQQGTEIANMISATSVDVRI